MQFLNFIFQEILFLFLLIILCVLGRLHVICLSFITSLSFFVFLHSLFSVCYYYSLFFAILLLLLYYFCLLALFFVSVVHFIFPAFLLLLPQPLIHIVLRTTSYQVTAKPLPSHNNLDKWKHFFQS